jgi:hypothetical protein
MPYNTVLVIPADFASASNTNAVSKSVSNYKIILIFQTNLGNIRADGEGFFLQT